MQAGPFIVAGALGTVGAAGFGLSAIAGKDPEGPESSFSQRELGAGLAAAGIIGGGLLMAKGMRSGGELLPAVLQMQGGALAAVAGVGAGIGALTDDG